MKIEAILHKLAHSTGSAMDPVAQMIADSKLPAEIAPRSTACRSGDARMGYVLLTGATGFLGAHLLRTLLHTTEARVCCLTRNSANGLARVRANLEFYGIWDASFENRIDVVDGDFNRADAGISGSDYRRLSESIEAIYHCGASVNWIYPYRRLAASNVLCTRDLLRLACTGRPKAFHFISSSSVCYSTSGPLDVHEKVDMLPHIDGMHLGYAQTKCVSESLLREAAGRGLAVTIFRPSMLAGDSVHGRSNCDDFLSRFIKGCIEMGCAPELDWFMDCGPVDTAAEAIVKLSQNCTAGAGLRVYHLRNPNGRYWHECILWLNLFGYPVRVIPYALWAEKLARVGRTAGHPLRQLVPFFCRAISGQPTAYLPSLYEEHRKIRVSSSATELRLECAGISWPALNAAMLDRYFEFYIGSGFLPAAPNRVTDFSQMPKVHIEEAWLSALLGGNVRQAIPLRDGIRHSIVSELTSWRFRTTAGLFPYRVELDNGAALAIMLKFKPRDFEVLAVAESIAGLCSDELGRAFAAARRNSEFVRCDVREPAVYAQQDARFKAHVPRFWGSDRQAMAIEYLTDVELKDSADDITGWTEPCIGAAVAGIAAIHSIWLQRRRDLMNDPVLGATLVDSGVQDLTPFRIALAEHARPWFSAWTDCRIAKLQEQAIAHIDSDRMLAAQLPSTLIHNDFNPRNVALKRSAGQLRLCAYDWEMARWGLPQHDLAEMLCFVLPPNVEKKVVFRWLETHRLTLERESGICLERDDWHEGFKIALSALLINRFAMYTMVHRFRKQTFLERVLKTWRRLHFIAGEA